MPDWQLITRTEAKAQLYMRETYFREGLADAQDTFGDALEDGLWHSSMIMVKADGLAAGTLAPVVEFLREHDFAVVGVEEVRFTRTLWRELWRFQLTSATLDRLAVNDAVHPGRSALLLLLRSGAGHDLPGTVRLSGLKGSAGGPAKGSLRDRLGQPNRVFSYVHVPDEPADLLRELGLLLDSRARRRALAALASGRIGDEGTARLEAALTAHTGRSLAAEPAARRIEAAIQDSLDQGTVAAEQAAQLLDHLKALDSGSPVPWRSFYQLAADSGLAADPWDLAILGATHVVCDETGFAKVLTNPDPEDWRTAPATVAESAPAGEEPDCRRKTPMFMHRITTADQMPDERAWHALTRSPRKRELFADDLYFREAWADADAVLGDGALDLLSQVALFNFKPDGLVGRRASRTLDFFEEHGFTVVGTAPMRLNRHSMREVWRYDWNVYTPDRLALCSLMHSATETVLLILRDHRYDGVIPAAVRLSDLKGSADPKARGPEALRSVLAPPNRVINFNHVADEPADLVREIGIFLDRAERRTLFEEVRRDFSSDLSERARSEVERLENLIPANDFDLDQALDRLEASGRIPADDMERLRKESGGGKGMAFDELTAIVDPHDPAIDRWDFVRVATEVLPVERKGFGGSLPAPVSADWVRTAAESPAP
ncbi:nucleoside-diphosphate kinase [Peterkaempfera bronchialis]|nr:nucleoside-diphosphate kinase [Peterkaempfera bronchialis]